MSNGKVLTTPEAESASHQMGSIINGSLETEISNLIKQGDILANPSVWEGRHAGTYRSGWPNTATQLREALAELGSLRTAVERVRADIVSAGGG